MFTLILYVSDEGISLLFWASVCNDFLKPCEEAIMPFKVNKTYKNKAFAGHFLPCGPWF